MNISNSKRKISRHESQECSQQSIVSAMDRFVTAVKNMEDTVLVPSRLMDMTADGHISKNVQQSVTVGTDLHGFYNILNNVKTELIWGQSGQRRNPDPLEDANTLFVQPSRSRSVSPNPQRRHIRKSSDCDSELSCTYDSDSGLDSITPDDCAEEDPAVHLATNFRHHLSGLFHTLHQLSEVSDYLTTRYQEEVGST